MKYSFVAKALGFINVHKFLDRRVLLMELFILFSSNSIGQTGRVHIHGNFPEIPGANFWCIPLNIDTPLVKGKLDIWLDSISAGPYPFGISFPIADSLYFTTRDKNGKLKYRKSEDGKISLITSIYLNPEQALDYKFEPVDGLDINKMKHFKLYDNFRSDVFGLNVRSKAEDTRIYQILQKMKEHYDHRVYYKVLDSLYQNSTVPDKIYQDYVMDAAKLNRKLNFGHFLKLKRGFAAQHLQSPIAPLALLDADSAHLVDNLNGYRQILNKMSGRAVQSDYYKNIILKIQNLSGVQLKKGDPFPMPSGKTPSAEKFNYQPSDHSYMLVVFWASWCAPCRAENPALNALQRAYKSSGFQILGVSLDQYPQEWRAAIKKDSLTDWLHVSDLQDPWNCPNALRYGLQAIPSNLLLDSDGNIISKNISLTDLKTFLKREK